MWVEDVSAGLRAVRAARPQILGERRRVDGADGLECLLIADTLTLELPLRSLYDGITDAEAAARVEFIELVVDALTGVATALIHGPRFGFESQKPH